MILPIERRENDSYLRREFDWRFPMTSLVSVPAIIRCHGSLNVAIIHDGLWFARNAKVDGFLIRTKYERKVYRGVE